MMLLLLLAGFWAIINCKHQGCAGEQAHAHPSLKQMHHNLVWDGGEKHGRRIEQAYNLQIRSYALVENGSWSPASGKLMNELLMQMSDMRQVGDTVTMLSTTNDESYKKLGDLATQLVQSLTGTLVPREEEPLAATQWRCKVCGFAYEGDALPEGYACPICGVGADMFERSAESCRHSDMPSMDTLGPVGRILPSVVGKQAYACPSRAGTAPSREHCCMSKSGNDNLL